MKTIFSLIFAAASILVSASSAQATTIASVDVGACTRDFNPWSRPSVCACTEDTRYDKRLGQCVQGEPVAITEEGMIGTEFAIGGETTGTVLVSANQDKYELVLARGLKAQLAELEAQGLTYRVVGEVIEVDGIESGKRPTIIVEGLQTSDGTVITGQSIIPTDF